jgi:iron complex transport system ATP-binding protein
MLKLTSLSVHYDSRPILRPVSLTVHRGEVLALIGPNGAGKSTLIRAASGALKPTSGQATADSVDLHRLSPEARARWLAVVPQAVHLPPAFTALDTVLMGRTPYLGWLGRESEADREIALAAMARTCTAELADRRVGELSGGESQRVLIARALAQSAPVLLMDEPTAHLDLKHQSGILGLVRGLAHDSGLAVLIVLHDLNLAAQYADRVALIAEGEIRALGAPETVLTADHLGPAYGLPVNVFAHPVNGAPLVLAQP